MNKQDKPRICEVLGVEVWERFYIKGYHPGTVFWITPSGRFDTDPPRDKGSSQAIMKAINEPDRIIHQPPTKQPTEQEREILRYLRSIYGDFTMECFDSTKIVLVISDSHSCAFPVEMFPFLPSGIKVSVSEVLCD